MQWYIDNTISNLMPYGQASKYNPPKKQDVKVDVTKDLHTIKQWGQQKVWPTWPVVPTFSNVTGWEPMPWMSPKQDNLMQWYIDKQISSLTPIKHTIAQKDEQDRIMKDQKDKLSEFTARLDHWIARIRDEYNIPKEDILKIWDEYRKQLEAQWQTIDPSQYTHADLAYDAIKNWMINGIENRKRSTLWQARQEAWNFMAWVGNLWIDQWADKIGDWLRKKMWKEPISIEQEDAMKKSRATPIDNMGDANTTAWSIWKMYGDTSLALMWWEAMGIGKVWSAISKLAGWWLKWAVAGGATMGALETPVFTALSEWRAPTANEELLGVGLWWAIPWVIWLWWKAIKWIWNLRNSIGEASIWQQTKTAIANVSPEVNAQYLALAKDRAKDVTKRSAMYGVIDNMKQKFDEFVAWPKKELWSTIGEMKDMIKKSWGEKIAIDTKKVLSDFDQHLADEYDIAITSKWVTPIKWKEISDTLSKADLDTLVEYRNKIAKSDNVYDAIQMVDEWNNMYKNKMGTEGQKAKNKRVIASLEWPKQWLVNEIDNTLWLEWNYRELNQKYHELSNMESEFMPLFRTKKWDDHIGAVKKLFSPAMGSVDEHLQKFGDMVWRDRASEAQIAKQYATKYGDDTVTSLLDKIKSSDISKQWITDKVLWYVLKKISWNTDNVLARLAKWWNWYTFDPKWIIKLKTITDKVKSWLITNKVAEKEIKNIVNTSIILKSEWPLTQWVNKEIFVAGKWWVKRGTITDKGIETSRTVKELDPQWKEYKQPDFDMKEYNKKANLADLEFAKKNGDKIEPRLIKEWDYTDKWVIERVWYDWSGAWSKVYWVIDWKKVYITEIKEAYRPWKKMSDIVDETMDNIPSSNKSRLDDMQMWVARKSQLSYIADQIGKDVMDLDRNSKDIIYRMINNRKLQEDETVMQSVFDMMKNWQVDNETFEIVNDYFDNILKKK